MIINDSDVILIEFKTGKINYLIFEIKENYNITDEKLDEIISNINKFYTYVYQNKIKFSQIYKLDMLSSINIYNETKILYKYIKFLESYNYMFYECNTCTGIIISSGFLKNIINSILYFYTNVKPVKLFDNGYDAKVWIKELNVLGN